MRSPRWDPSSSHSAARTPMPFYRPQCSRYFVPIPLAYFVPFFFFPCFSSFFLFPFAVLRFPLAFRFVVFRCFLFRLLRFSFCFPALLGGAFCSFVYTFVSVLHTPRAACEPANLRIPLVCCLACFLALVYFIFYSLPSVLRFRFRRRFVSSCLFLVGIMLSLRFLLRLVQRMIRI